MTKRRKLPADHPYGHHDSVLAQYMAYMIGFEGELVLVCNTTGKVVGKAAQLFACIPAMFLAFIVGEFQSHQIEVKIPPQRTIMGAVNLLFRFFEVADKAAAKIGCRLEAISYVEQEEEFTLDAVSKLDPGYMKYARANMHKLDAMCRVAGFQVVFGMPHIGKSIDVHNCFSRQIDRLLEKWSDPRRVALFDNVIFPQFYRPKSVMTAEALVALVERAGCLENLGRFYPSVRIHHKYPTVELRFAGALRDRKRIIELTVECWKIAFPYVPVPFDSIEMDVRSNCKALQKEHWVAPYRHAPNHRLRSRAA